MHGLGQQARAVGGVLVLAVVGAGFPIETIGEGTLRTEGDVPALFVVLGAGRFVAAQFERIEHALQLDQVTQGGIVVRTGGRTGTVGGEAVAGGAPELGAAAGLGVGLVEVHAAEQLGGLGDVEGAVAVGVVAAVLVPQRARGDLVIAAAVGAAGGGGHGGVAELVARSGVVDDVLVAHVAVQAASAQGGQGQRRVDRDARRVVAGVGQDVALGGEHRLVLAVLQRVGRAPAVTGLAAGVFEVDAVATAFFGGAGGQADLLAIVVLAQHDVDHACHGVGAVDGRRATGQHFHALDDRARDRLDVDHVVVAVVRLRVLRRAAAVDQGQGVARAQVAQVHHLGIGREAAHGQVAGEGAGGVLGQGLQHVADRLEAFTVDIGTRDHGDRRRAFHVGALDARTHHGHAVQVDGVLAASFVAGFLCEGRCDGRNDQRRCQRKAQRVAAEQRAICHE
ncbi:hypothetical protein D3C71_754450 [compost metagenome]